MQWLKEIERLQLIIPQPRCTNNCEKDSIHKVQRITKSFKTILIAEFSIKKNINTTIRNVSFLYHHIYKDILTLN